MAISVAQPAERTAPLRAAYLLSLLTVLYLSATGAKSYVVPCWFDELFTLYLSGQHSLVDLAPGLDNRLELKSAFALLGNARLAKHYWEHRSRWTSIYTKARTKYRVTFDLLSVA